MRFPQHSFKNAIVGFTVGEKSLIMQLYADLKIDSKKFKRLPNTPGNARFQLHWHILLYFELFLHAQRNRTEN